MTQASARSSSLLPACCFSFSLNTYWAYTILVYYMRLR